MERERDKMLKEIQDQIDSMTEEECEQLLKDLKEALFIGSL